MQAQYVKDFLNYYAASKKSLKTVEGYGKSLQIFVDYLAENGGKELCQATAADIMGYVALPQRLEACDHCGSAVCATQFFSLGSD